MREKRKLARLLFASILLSGSSMVMAQTDKPVTVQLKQASIRELFMEIKKQAKVNFMYSNNAVEGLKKKDYDFTNASLEKILAHCLEGTGLTFEIADDNRTVVIKRKQQDAEYAVGAVVDRDGMPLAGVSIKQEGAKQGTVTGFGGEFSLPLEPTKDGKAPLLIVSFIGMKTQRLTWEGRVLNIYMEDDAQNLDEVVVTGYQVINKRALTSAVTTVKAEDIIRRKKFRAGFPVHLHRPQRSGISTACHIDRSPLECGTVTGAKKKDTPIAGGRGYPRKSLRRHSP